MQPPVHVEGAFCGSLVPGGDFCPRIGAFLWMRRENSNRLSTQEVLFVEVWCWEGTFVHKKGIFCGRGRK